MKNLKKARKAKGLTAEQLAQLLHFSKGTINGYEQEIREPDLQTLIKLSELLDCSVDYLIGNEKGITISQSEYKNLKSAQESLNKAMNPINNRIQNVNINGSNNKIIIGNNNKTKGE